MWRIALLCMFIGRTSIRLFWQGLARIVRLIGLGVYAPLSVPAKQKNSYALSRSFCGV